MIMSWHWVQHTPSTAYTKYSIHQVQHTPSTVYTKYSIHRVQHTPDIVCLHFILKITSWPLNVAWPSGVPPYTIDRHHPALHENSKDQSPCHIAMVASTLTDEKSLSSQPAVHRLPLRIRPNSLDYGLQVHLQSRSIMASKCISKCARLRPSSSHDHGLQVQLHTHLITASKCFSKLARSRPLSASPNSLDFSLQVYL